MLSDVVEHLRCPHCGGGLAVAGPALACPRGHGFDVARQGYVNLLPGDARPGTADTSEMVEARAAFLAGGHFEPIAEALSWECARLLTDVPRGPIVELGAGTGYHLAHALRRVPDRVGIALDVSRHAARRAARAHRRIGAVVCDAWRALPLGTGTAAAVLSVFSPRNGVEMRRVLRGDGALVAVTPTAAHLSELVEAAGLVTVDPRKEERLESRLGHLFELERRRELGFELSLGHAELERLVRMGPSARHVDAAATRARIAALPEPSSVTVSVTVRCYRPR